MLPLTLRFKDWERKIFTFDSSKSSWDRHVSIKVRILEGWFWEEVEDMGK